MVPQPDIYSRPANLGVYMVTGLRFISEIFNASISKQLETGGSKGDDFAIGSGSVEVWRQIFCKTANLTD